MKIAILQYAPRLGRIKENISRAEKLLDEATSEIKNVGVDLLILPELALTGQ
jgi:predicted amidohydrolase